MSSFRMWFLQGLEVDVFNGNTRTHIFTTFTGLKHLMALINLNTTGLGKYWLTTEKRGLKHERSILHCHNRYAQVSHP